MQNSYNVKIAGTGIYLPENVYSNQDVIDLVNKTAKEKGVEVPPLNSEWIENNIFIKERRFFTPDEKLEDVSMKALEDALKNAEWSAMDLDFIILCSISMWGDDDSTIIPSIACLIQEKVGAYNAFAYDMIAACSGFVYGFTQGTCLIDSGMAKKGAVICTERQKIGLDFTDHVSSVLIGDVATATLLEASEDSNVKGMKLISNNERKQSNIITLPYKGYFSLKGKSVFKEGISTMTRLTLEALEKNNLTHEDVDWFIYHQANGAMLRMVGDKVGFDPKKNLMNIQELGNTTAGTIPSVLHMNIQNGNIKRGQKVCMVAFGGGITAGSVIVEF